MIRKAKINDLNRIDEIAVETIQNMMDSNIPQWDFNYPRKEHYHQDIIDDCLYVFDEESVLGAICLKPENDPPYKDLDNWTDEESLVIHRVIVDPNVRRKGIAKTFFLFAEELAREMGYNSIKVDTHKENYKMNGFLTKLGYVEKGYLPSIDRIAFEKLVR